MKDENAATNRVRTPELVRGEEDTDPREVTVPQDMRQALAGNPEAEAFFNQLSYTHQKEYVRWIEEAKRDQTRQRRVGRAIELLKQGMKGR